MSQGGAAAWGTWRARRRREACREKRVIATRGTTASRTTTIFLAMEERYELLRVACDTSRELMLSCALPAWFSIFTRTHSSLGATLHTKMTIGKLTRYTKRSTTAWIPGARDGKAPVIPP